jgi:hypothetical protein
MGLLITRRSLSVPASGAKVRPPLPPRSSLAASSADMASIRREGSDIIIFRLWQTSATLEVTSAIRL